MSNFNNGNCGFEKARNTPSGKKELARLRTSFLESHYPKNKKGLLQYLKTVRLSIGILKSKYGKQEVSISYFTGNGQTVQKSYETFLEEFNRKADLYHEKYQERYVIIRSKEELPLLEDSVIWLMPISKYKGFSTNISWDSRFGELNMAPMYLINSNNLLVQEMRSTSQNSTGGNLFTRTRILEKNLS